MKIVLTIHHFPPTYSAGAEVYVLRLAGWLARHGHEVEVVCIESITHQNGTGLEYTQDVFEGVSVWRLYFNLELASNPFRQSFDNPDIGDWFLDFLQQTRPDIVHINSCYLLSVSTITAAKRQALPLIITLHDFWFVCPRITLLKPSGDLCTVPEKAAECAWCLATERRRFRWPDAMLGGISPVAQQWMTSPPAAKLLGIEPDESQIVYRRELLTNALNQADLILSPSEFLRHMFIDQGIDPARIFYSRLGLDTSHWITPPEKSPEPRDYLHIAYIGQLAPHKGIHLLLSAFNKFDDPRRQAHLTVYGDPTAVPDYSQSLLKIANGNPRIEFAGRFDNSRIAAILSQVDVVVVPSIWYENSPIAIMEALTTGTPVVTSDLGGMSELVKHGVNGLLFRVGDVDDLADQLNRLLDDRELLRTLSGNSRPVRMIDEEMLHIVSLYEQLLQ